MTLETFLFYLSWFNTTVTVIMGLSPVVQFIQVIKGKEKYTVVPETMLITVIGNNVGWGCYWYRMGETVPMTCSIICCSLGIIFSIIYLYYMAEQKLVKFGLYTLLMLDIVFQLLLLFLKGIQSLKIVGGILMVVNTLMYVAPAQNILTAIKTKNSALIPIAPSLSGAVCSGGWFTFGFLKKDINCMVPNGLGCFFSVVTSIVWVYLTATKPKDEEEEKGKEHLTNEVNESP